MSEVIASASGTGCAIECVLSASDSYIETLSIQAIEAQPGALELVIKTQLLSAKNPAEKRVIESHHPMTWVCGERVFYRTKGPALDCQLKPIRGLPLGRDIAEGVKDMYKETN